jgi:hypothetical protein
LIINSKTINIMHFKIMWPLLFLAGLITLLLPACSTSKTGDWLKDGFLNPPDSARPGVYWYFMDGNLDRRAMTEDLESMKKAGIGYVLFLEVNVGIPRGKVDFLSEEWQELYKHAVREAERLGIRIILGSGPGWAGSGGPWITPQQSMMHLVASDTTIKGPSLFEGILPLPAPKKPFFGEGSLTKNLKMLRDNWYEDVAVLGFPTPSTKSAIDGIDEKALYYRAPYTSQQGVLPFIPSSSKFSKTKDSLLRSDQIIDLTTSFQKDGRLLWEVPRGNWTIMRFVKRNNGAVTRPAPAPGLGFESDKFDTVSFDSHYNAYVGKLVNKVHPVKTRSGGGWTMIHIDSWEMGSQNWTNNFREEFIKRRGYDPLPYLPVYKGVIVNSMEMSERFLWDLRQTSNELIIENHAERFRYLGQKSGFRLSIEPYDMNPASDIDLGSVADVPMCEFWSDGFGFNSSFSCIEATSIAHIKGAPVVAAESFTADHSEAWKKYPGDMKNQGDWAFSMGINRLIYHTFAHKPLDNRLRPGMTMGPYGVHWDRGQTWWPMVDAYHKYITRSQYILSQGIPVADILYLTPEGAPQVFLPPPSALDGTKVMPDKKGYSFDGCSPMFLINNASVTDGQIVFPGGAKYSILVLPEIKTMTPALVAKIGSLVNEGATVLGNPPLKSPSLTDYPACDTRVKELADSIWARYERPIGKTERAFGKGKIWWDGELEAFRSDTCNLTNPANLYPDYNETIEILANRGIKPDFTSSGSIRYTHRKLVDREVYFISNRTVLPVSDTCYFRDGTANAEIWDAVTGNINPLQTIRSVQGTTGISVRLDPFQSYFVIFYHLPLSVEKQSRGYIVFKDKKTIQILEGRWNVKFETIWGGPGEITFDTLCDWSKRPEDGIRYYSGIASYSKDFDLMKFPAAVKEKQIWLDLGKVRNLARVKLNGKDLGIVWTSPWQVNIAGVIKDGHNHLEIEVANLWINRLIGDESFPWDGIQENKWPEWIINGTPRTSKRYSFTTHRYYKKDDPLAESGLIGQVSIKINN